LQIRKRVFFSALSIAIAFCFAGCVTPGAIEANSKNELPTMQQKYSVQFEKTHIGMAFEDFQNVWPEAIKSSEDGIYVIYEYRDIQTYYTSHDKDIGVLWTGSIYTQEYIQKTLFYFTEKKLAKYETKAE